MLQTFKLFPMILSKQTNSSIGEVTDEGGEGKSSKVAL
jgi:hypothetical protein